MAGRDTKNRGRARGAGRVGALAATLVLLGACSMWGGGGEKPETTAATAPAATAATLPTATASPAATASTSAATTPTSATATNPGEIDVRRYLGSNYCPEIRVLSGAELMRRYEKGHDEDPNYIIWQASVGKTARECLWDLQGGLTLRVGISGRVIAGPKGATAATVAVPLKVVVVKYQESILATEQFSKDVAVPAQGAAVFTQVKDILVPSPGQDRDYLIYIGLDVGEWDAMNGQVAPVAVVEEPPPPPPPPPAPAPQPAAPTTPNVLPTPDDGFVLQ